MVKIPKLTIVPQEKLKKLEESEKEFTRKPRVQLNAGQMITFKLSEVEEIRDAESSFIDKRTGEPRKFGIVEFAEHVLFVPPRIIDQLREIMNNTDKKEWKETEVAIGRIIKKNGKWFIEVVK